MSIFLLCVASGNDRSNLFYFRELSSQSTVVFSLTSCFDLLFQQYFRGVRLTSFFINVLRVVSRLNEIHKKKHTEFKEGTKQSSKNSRNKFISGLDLELKTQNRSAKKICKKLSKIIAQLRGERKKTTDRKRRKRGKQMYWNAWLDPSRLQRTMKAVNKG